MPDDMRPPDDDLEMIEMAGELTKARQGIPQPERQGEAFARLMGEVEARKMGTSTNGTGLLGWLGGSRWRGILAATAAAVVLGGAGLGAAAATGNEPARKLFGISTDSAIKVEFKGVVVEATATELRIDANGDLRIVTVDAATSFGDDDDGVESIADIAPGMIVEVHGRLLADNTILATRVDIDDDDDGLATPGATQPAPTATAPAPTPPPAPTAVPPTVPAAQPTFDDDDDGGDDDSGPGGGDDDGVDDGSGPGSGDDDGGDDDDGGSGTGGDDGGGGGDDTGSGSGDDDGGDDDDSGSGGGDDDGGDDDDSGSGGGDDDGGDD